MKADLHNHTKYSDGVFSVKELANFKKQEGFDLIAITDHDSVNAYQNLNEPLAIPILIGVELSTYYCGENIHLLGYFKQNKAPSLQIRKFLNHLEIKRKDRVLKMIHLLKTQKIEINYESVLKYADGAIARPHVAKAIQEKYPLSWEDVFEQLIGEDALCYVPTEYLDLEDAIRLLHQNEALAVLAHPHYIVKNKVEDLIPLGLDGLEVYYPTMRLEDQQIFLSLAKENHLIVTGGSDFHEVRDKKENMFPYGVEGDLLEAFLKELEVKIS